MTTAQQRGWGDPDAPGYAKNHIVSVTAGGVKLQVRREVASIFVAFCDDLARRGYPLDRVADDWGYANRDIRGRPGVKSNHSWGLAVDLNATTNPMTSDGRNHTDMPAWVIDAAARYGLFWGGHYSGSRRDPMHFEFLGTPADAAGITARLTSAPSPPARPAPTVEDLVGKPVEYQLVTKKGGDGAVFVSDGVRLVKGVPNTKVRDLLVVAGLGQVHEVEPWIFDFLAAR